MTVPLVSFHLPIGRVLPESLGFHEKTVYFGDFTAQFILLLFLPDMSAILESIPIIYCRYSFNF